MFLSFFLDVKTVNAELFDGAPRLKSRGPWTPSWATIPPRRPFTRIFIPIKIGMVCCWRDQKITVIFRYDDYSSKSPLEFEHILLKLFQDHHISSTWGVIPYVTAGDSHDGQVQPTLPLSGQKLELLKQGIKSGLLEVALHGYSHQSLSFPAEMNYTEFETLGYPRQLEKILQGKLYLEQRLASPIMTFIPPWGTYDNNTIRILKSLNFRILSTLKWKAAEAYGSFYFIPSTCVLLDLENAIKAARHLPDPQPIIVVVFHPFDFTDFDKNRGKFSMAEFSTILDWLSRQSDVHTATFAEAVRQIHGLDGRHFLSYQKMRRLFIYLPIPFKILYLKYISCVFLSPAGVANMGFILIGLSVLIYGLMFAGAFLITHKIFAKLLRCRSELIGLYRLLLLAMYLLISAIVVIGHKFNHIGILSFVIMLGIYFGFIKTVREHARDIHSLQ